jgi:hypothetical protein
MINVISAFLEYKKIISLNECRSLLSQNFGDTYKIDNNDFIIYNVTQVIYSPVDFNHVVLFNCFYKNNIYRIEFNFNYREYYYSKYEVKFSRILLIEKNLWKLKMNLN